MFPGLTVLFSLFCADRNGIDRIVNDGREGLLEALAGFSPLDADERRHGEDLAGLVRERSACFLRTLMEPGHVTGSALLISADGSRALMNHHKVLDKWLCFGGHADGETDILNVAVRETVEESGIAEITPVFGGIFDVDVHPIAANPNRNEPAHLHFDIRYLLRAGNDNCNISDESLNLQWCTYDEACAKVRNEDLGMHRLLYKWNVWKTEAV